MVPGGEPSMHIKISGSKNISEVKGYSDWDCNGFFPLVTPALSGSEEAIILVW